LEPSTRAIVSPQLYRLADEFIFKQAFNPLPSTDAIHATLILSLWEPVGDPTPKESRDGRLVASTAVSMAMNLRLSEAMVYARTLGSQKKSNEASSAELIEALEKARLWFALTNIESMLCAGTGREPISDRASLIYGALDTTSHATIGATRDMRLTLFSQLFATTRQGLSIRLRSASELGVFYKEVLDFLIHMDSFEHLICPLPTEHEAFYFHILQVYHKYCRLLVLVHALIETKQMIKKTDPQTPWFLVAEHNGVNLAKSWGNHALLLSEGILVTMLSRPELTLLSSAPDNFFSIITLATIFVILSKWSVLEHAGEHMPGSSDSILARTIERLSLVACSPDHIAARCATVIEAGVRSFKRKLEELEIDPKEFSKPVVQHFTPRQFVASTASTSSGGGGGSNGIGTGGYPTAGCATGMTTGGGVQGGGMYPQQTLPSFPMSDPNYFMNSDLFLDNEFWSSFMANLASDGSGMGTMGR
jgi:hypothetical protein